jgi:hypothetical protein
VVHGAACLSPARPAPGRGNARQGELLGDLGRGSGRFAGDGRAWSGGSAAAAPIARWRTLLSRGHGAPARGALARGERWLWRFIGEALRLGARRDGAETPAGRSSYGDGAARTGAGKARRAHASGQGAGSADSRGVSACVPISGGPQPREARPQATRRA